MPEEHSAPAGRQTQSLVPQITMTLPPSFNGECVECNVSSDCSGETEVCFNHKCEDRGCTEIPSTLRHATRTSGLQGKRPAQPREWEGTTKSWPGSDTSRLR
jgi:hypothetical protein